ncbi:hypothetical protein FJ934_11330 [Mesorhizobium sp. B2-4-12]|uniref:hypothetical protein n=1 Tax=Mesorhizobium sp. B2-4-12 TaxID=2589937 RepID=UPI00112BCE3F|nr:hypothetical protein [Mesorhizobium sp. B2-4-12]TPK90031.1 hypothetical protein FJ548_08790 [Mesorhizobium sp. B2-4-17]TPK95807.1 hypothetical protein FJ934_11330 [Mesorhizobium sp. B2-4-12]
MERLSFAQICGLMSVALVALWGAQQARDYFLPKQTTVENPVLVPEYELRRQRDEAWTNKYAYALV